MRIVELEGKTYLVVEVEDTVGGLDFLFVELGLANEKLIEAYYSNFQEVQ